MIVLASSNVSLGVDIVDINNSANSGISASHELPAPETGPVRFRKMILNSISLREAPESTHFSKEVIASTSLLSLTGHNSHGASCPML